MLTRKTITVVVLAAALTISGCTKPEEPDHFRYTVNDYPLGQGFIHNYGLPENGTGYNFDVTLYSQGVSYNRDLHEFQGSGHVVYFQMYSASATELSAGTYQFSVGDSKSPGTFDVANFGMNLDFADDTGTLVHAVSGVVEVSGTGADMVFDFECQTDTGEKVTGHFSGWISVYDMRTVKK